MNNDIKIVTLGDIFENLQTEEKALKFFGYIIYLQRLQEENKKLNYILNSKFADICKKEMIDKLSAVEMIVLQQERINKGIEFIKENIDDIVYSYSDSRNLMEKLIDILEGDSDEKE